jgi:hypothetical protein
VDDAKWIRKDAPRVRREPSNRLLDAMPGDVVYRLVDNTNIPFIARKSIEKTQAGLGEDRLKRTGW